MLVLRMLRRRLPLSRSGTVQLAAAAETPLEEQGKRRSSSVVVLFQGRQEKHIAIPAGLITRLTALLALKLWNCSTDER
jgi:hypothetical protein